MYVHIGGEKVIRAKEMIAIFDISIETSSKIFKSFIAQASTNKTREVVSEEASKSIILTINKLYYSPISCTTIKKRLQQSMME
jgi:hypothetical protein